MDVGGKLYVWIFVLGFIIGSKVIVIVYFGDRFFLNWLWYLGFIGSFFKFFFGVDCNFR